MGQKTFGSLLFVLAASLLSGEASAFFKKDRVKRDFRHMDANRDDQISREEWKRRGNFEKLDQNGDGYLTIDEVRGIYQGHQNRDYDWPPENMTPYSSKIDPSIATDRVSRDELGADVICGLGRAKHCGTAEQIRRGLLETGTGPVFPKGVDCPGVDDYWAMNYSYKRNRDSFHGGIDIPVPWGEPMRVVASGAVVNMYQAHQSKRGYEVIVRHSPEDTGLPMWTYSAYGHLDRLPDFKPGQRLAMGDIIGPTGNSGISARGKKGSGAQSKSRRPAIHLAMFYSAHRQFGEENDTILPKEGYWLDPYAFYRQKEPFLSAEVKALPEDEKAVMIPVLLEGGRTIPANTKIIWPYSCR
ncbi:peptidoglycan DD-metalloendopeptidase family protein [Terasakiella sp. SH-1]|uniref:peptidoglycan DD-metalloendopeptidase family protein n=1 Tax=Terasakiella sp. SH-1 TaxID=2560057 RepID=UPI0014314B33|nr:peptidoglycan DD-metalloendopeptidase family protein [Terasakiella sp. SH-1]